MKITIPSLIKFIIVLVGSLSTLAAAAQKSTQDRNSDRILVGINFSPDYDYRTLHNNDGTASADLVIKNRNDIEIAKAGFTAGMSLWINLSKRTWLETGILFSNKGYKTTDRDLIYFPPDPNLPVKARTVYSYQYIGIPLKLNFTFGNGNVRFISAVGFMADLLLNVKNSTRYTYSDGRKENRTQSSVTGFKKLGISPVISLGLDYKINSRIHLMAEPTFRYGIINTKDAPVTEKLWNAGLNITAAYRIR